MEYKCKLCYFPLFCSGFMLVIMAVFYYWSTSRGDVVTWLPTVSETGSLLPERGVFSFLVFIESAATGMAVYFRYRHIKWLNVGRLPVIDNLGQGAAILGYMAALGMVGVGAFPESTQLQIHLLSAVILFSAGTLYMVADVILTGFLHSGRILLSIRSTIVVIGIVLSIMTAVFFYRGRMQWRKEEHEHTKYKRTAEDLGFHEYTAAAVCEWGLILSLMLYFFTLAFEMRSLYSKLGIALGDKSDPEHGERTSFAAGSTRNE